MFDLLTGDVTGTFRHPQLPVTYICDVKVHGDDLIAVDWHGKMQQWKILPNRDLIYVSSFTPLSIDLATLEQYTSFQKNRLLEFNNFIGMSNVEKLFCIWNMGDVHCIASWIATESDILCSKILGHSAFWGEKNGSVHQYLYQEDQPSIPTMIGHVQTKFQDSITSLSVMRENVVFGNTNGEIHCSKLPLSQDNQFECVLVTEHRFGASVSGIQVDGPRIFSGDTDGKLVVHDFWNYEERTKAKIFFV